MTTADQAWGWLRRELDAWSERDMLADFWWRDDDAIESSPQLQRLLQLAARHRLPVALAVIPESLRDTLPVRLDEAPNVSVLQHGYAHRNPAPKGERKRELGGDYPLERARREIETGRDRLSEAFGNRFLEVMVPPWNRIDDEVQGLLPELEFRGISAMRVRRAPLAAPGLLRVNAHLDPVHWRHRRGFIGLFPAIAILVQHLAARRTGYRDLDEPTGILSHHLAQNDAVWRFLDDLAAFLNAHPACRWRGADTIWPSAPG